MSIAAGIVYSSGMKRATITLTDDLEQAIERYRQGFENPPELDDILLSALELYFSIRPLPGDHVDGPIDDEDDIIFPTSPKPEPSEDPPALLDGGSVANAVIEDRR